jgi:hypothetical protein
MDRSALQRPTRRAMGFTIDVAGAAHGPPARKRPLGATTMPRASSRRQTPCYVGAVSHHAKYLLAANSRLPKYSASLQDYAIPNVHVFRHRRLAVAWPGPERATERAAFQRTERGSRRTHQAPTTANARGPATALRTSLQAPPQREREEAAPKSRQQRTACVHGQRPGPAAKLAHSVSGSGW